MPSVRGLVTDAKRIQERLIVHQPVRLRDRVRQLQVDNRACLLTGPRGTGKTTWLLRQCEQEHYLYISVDHPAFSATPLYSLIEAAFLEGYEGILLDEVHYAFDWARHLKAAYDAFPNKRLLASDSSTIVLREGTADLSRRFPMKTMPLLSFREYLMLRLDCDIPLVDPFNHQPAEIRLLLKDINVLRYFKEYLQGGFRPFFIESADLYMEKVMNTLTKTMEADIPFLVPQLADTHLRLMNAVVGYIAMSDVPRLAVSSLCAEWGISKTKLYQLLDAMQRAHLIRIVRKINDTKLHSSGAKIFLHEPSVYPYFGNNLGTMREAYAACAFEEAGKTVFAASREADSDFVVDGYRLEVGGATKSMKKADFVVRDDVDVPFDNVIPLWMLGLQY